MQSPPNNAAEEIRQLQRCLNDLIALVALPAMWSGREPVEIGQAFINTIHGMLDLDLAYVRLIGLTAPVEVGRAAPSTKLPAESHEIGMQLTRWLGTEAPEWPALARQPVAEGELSIAVFRLGLQGELGVFVAGSKRIGFPVQSEKLLLRVAANQAAIGVTGARLLGEQRQVAAELDWRVGERTEALAAANRELHLQVGLLQHIPVAAWTIGVDGTPDFVNQNWLAYTGQSLDYVRSGPEAWMTAMHPEDRETASRIFWEGIHSGRGFTMDARFRRMRDGVYRWHLNRAVPFRDAAGNTVKFVGTSTDIEDLKQSQESLKTADEKTRLIIDTALDAVITMDAGGVVTSWNRQAEITFGWETAEAIGQRMSDLVIPASHRAAHERGLRHFLATGEGPILRRRIETMGVRRGGEEFPVELEVVPMQQGQSWAFSAFIRDITGSKVAEQKLRDSEINLRQISETIPEMLWSANANGEIDYCNVRLLDYTGFAMKEIKGSGWTKLFHPDDVEHASAAWRSSIAGNAPYRVEVRTFHAADRTYRWCVTTALPLLDESGRLLRWHGTVVDMHDWKLAQEELRDTQAELAHLTRALTMGELTASIAHEVNQPLSGIITNAGTCLRMLAADPPNIDGALETARRTIRDGRRASDVIQRLRALFSRKDFVIERVDVAEAAREVIALSMSQIQKNRVTLRTEFPEGLPQVDGDRVQLQQVILNLILNGSEAMAAVEDRPRQLLIKAEHDGTDRVSLTVQDAGVGFGPQGVEKLFEAFYTTKNNGMGIGLSVSRSIIERHRGRLWAVANDGPGATFCFSIPCSHEDRASAGGADLPNPEDARAARSE